ncbi:hypothetical protein Clacol_004767 [Clathrus columnatus]|uniref:MFS general substrate transporter n=1 Tax=Clathrus columnatus TaxID=1419009 RepID=A0AAV5AF14_9AGAM|nr:hypothetical protein Clacol_004767 [Clathrus columnatus]
MSDTEKQGAEHGSQHSEYSEDLDLSLLHEAHAGRLVVDPEEARVEFGTVAARLKLNKRGNKVLWPQPYDTPEDPQNWSIFKKNYLLLIITLAAITPDFNSGVGIAAIFALATQFDTSTGEINNLTSNWSIFLLGWGGLFAVMLMRRYGRLPILFWSQLISVGFLVGSSSTAVSNPSPNGLTPVSSIDFIPSSALLAGKWRNILLMALIYEGVLFGFSIGINVTFAVFLGLPLSMGGYNFKQFSIAGCYATPIIAVLIGETIGRYGNDSIANFFIKRNHGVFEAEMRLWMCYLALPLYICGFVVIGAAFQKHLTIGALIMGWGIAETAVMMTTVAIYAYANDCFPRHQGEISALINLARTLGGFAVAYFQVPWATSRGALQTFGVEAAIVAALFIMLIPLLQIKGRAFREKYSI